MRAKDKSTNNNASGQLHLTSRFTSAIEYARILHIERRKGTDVPYMAHLLGVASLVMGEAGHAGFPVTEDMVIAALLHDAAEDQGGELRLKDIEHNFGSTVARMVEGLSDSLTADPHHKESWPERKKAYIRRLRKEPADVRLISAADKLYNARAILEDYRQIGPRVWDRFKRGGSSLAESPQGQRFEMPKRSAGLLMYRRSKGHLEVFLIHPGGPYFAKKDKGAWAIPKGEYEKNEDPLIAARREFEEETGFTAAGDFLDLGSIKQRSGKIVTVAAFEGDCDPADLVSNTCLIEWPPHSGRSLEIPEVDQGRWFGMTEAREYIRKDQEELLDRLREAFRWRTEDG